MNLESVGAERIQRISSRDNPFVKQLRRLAEHNTAYREAGHYWVEGEHLCHAAVQHGLRARVAVLSESRWSRDGTTWLASAERAAVLPDRLFAHASGVESASGLGLVLPLPNAGTPRRDLASVVLDRLQDAGNLGSILRSAAAFGFSQVLALKGSAALWSPKVLRAGMGAHFGLALVEGLEVSTLRDLGLPLIVTSSHRGELLHACPLPWPCAWAFGHEGQGVSEELESQARLSVRIAQPGGGESLNVAAAAAVCLHASLVGQLT